MLRQSCKCALLAGVPLALVAGLAHAQEVDPTRAQDAPNIDQRPGEQPPPLVDPALAGPNEIVVTAERRLQTLQDYAGVAQAFTDQELQAVGVDDIETLQVLVPGLNVANQEGNIEIFIRGVGTANNTELGDPSAATHFNSVYLPRPRGLSGMFFDLARVEVAKGPQGTLRGRNAVAGTLNIVPQAPKLGVVEGFAQVEVGTYDQRGFEAAINVPLGSTLALRVAAFGQDRGSTYENVGLDQELRAAGEESLLSGRATLLFEPSDRLRISLLADYEREDGTGYPGTNILGALAGGLEPDDFELREVLYRGTQGDVDSDHWGVAFQGSYDFGPAVIEYLGSYRSLNFTQTNASNEGVIRPGFGPEDVNYDSFSTVYWLTRSRSQVHEMRLVSSPRSQVIWSLGAFYFDEDQDVGFLSVADNGIFYSGTEFTSRDVNGSSLAFYGDVTYPLTERFRLKGGLRYTEEEKSRVGVGGNYTLGLGAEGFDCCFATRFGTPGFRPNFLGRPDFGYVAPTTSAEVARYFGVAFTPGTRDTILQQIAGVADGTRPNGTCVNTPETNPDGRLSCPADGQHSFFVLGGPAEQRGSYEGDFLDWRAGVEFEPTPDNLLYGTVSTGHKSGGFNDTIEVEGVAQAPIFDPEVVRLYEIGSKNTVDFLGRRANLNANIFYYDYNDQVFPTLVAIGGSGTDQGFSQQNVNVGNSTIWGAELEGRVALPAGLRLDVIFAYLDATVDDGALFDTRAQDFGPNTPNYRIDIGGNRLPLASKINLNVHLQQVIELFGGEVDWHILANYRSDYFTTIYNEDPVVNGTLPTGGGTIDPENPPAGLSAVDARDAGFWGKQDGYVQINLGLGYGPQKGRWRVEGFVNNLFDETVVEKQLVSNTNVNLLFLNQPRTAGARLRVNF